MDEFERNRKSATLRANATQRTLNQWTGKPMEWGKSDCARMFISHCRRFGIRPKLAKAGKWDSPMSALAALRRTGFNSLIEYIDSMPGLSRQSGAQALIGDVAIVQADHPLGSIAICVGPNQWIGLHEDPDGFTVIEILEFLSCWRIEWQKPLTK